MLRPGLGVYAFNISTLEGRGRGTFFKLKASLTYIESPRPARATECDVSFKKKNSTHMKKEILPFIMATDK